MKRDMFLFIVLSALLSGCWGLEQNGGTLQNVAPGNWRGVFSFEESDDRVPITFEVRNTNEEGGKAEIGHAADDGARTARRTHENGG